MSTVYATVLVGDEIEDGESVAAVVMDNIIQRVFAHSPGNSVHLVHPGWTECWSCSLKIGELE